MKSNFDPDELYNRLPYGTTVPNNCPGMTTLEFVLRGNEAQLEDYIKTTPFNLADDRFIFSISDYTNSAIYPYYDALLLIPVEYKGMRGSFPAYEYENLSRSVFGGREKWGYPKVFGDIAMTEADGKWTATVTQNETRTVTATWEPADDAARAQDLGPTWPHFPIRAFPKTDGPGIAFAEVLRRDTSSDFQLTSKTYGTGTLSFDGPAPHEMDTGFSELEIHAVEQASVIIGDWYSTEKNGWAYLVDRLV